MKNKKPDMATLENDTKIRCFGGKPGQEFYAHYHDDEWGIPSHDDRRNRLKINGTRRNAHAFLSLQEECGSINSYLWSFVNGKPIQNHWSRFEEVPVQTPVSDALSKDLKKRGMTFVDSTIIYSSMQAIGVVNDHLTTCWRYRQA